MQSAGPPGAAARNGHRAANRKDVLSQSVLVPMKTRSGQHPERHLPGNPVPDHEINRRTDAFFRYQSQPPVHDLTELRVQALLG
jgi:hypothetical protein